jgi:choice-of-anchor B domain-containing protein
MNNEARLTRRRFLRLGAGTLVMSHWWWNARSAETRAQGSQDLLVPVAKVDLPSAGLRGFGSSIIQATGLWARGTLVVVPNINWINLVEFSDLKNPQVVTIDIREIGGDCRDVDFYENYLICGLVSANENRRVLIYDISDWKNPKLVSTVQSDVYDTVHNVFVAGKVCFLPTIGDANGELFMIDLSDPANPKDLGAVRFLDRFLGDVHDVTVVGNRLYAAAWENGFWVIDFENLDNPSQLRYVFKAQQRYGRGASHNVWPSPDGKLLFTGDESPGDFVRSFDISDLANIRALGQYGLGAGTIPHNVVVDGTYVYIAYYANGVRVLEYSDPQNLKEVATFNPHSGRARFSHGFDGFWDVYPFGKYVLASDMQTGLWILEKKGILAGK